MDRIKDARARANRFSPLMPAVFLMAAMLLGAAGWWGLSSRGPAHPLAAQATAGPAEDPLDVAAALGDAFAAVAERARPAVVTITSERVVSSRSFHSDQMPEFFQRFFGPRRGTPREHRQWGLGSGFIVSADGRILTANHVVAEAENILVRLSDGRQLDAEIIGTDPKTDVAVIQVESDEPLPYLELGDSDAMRVGEWVLALGTPFGERLRETVTAGIISAKGRSRIGLTDYEDFIQTDAAINRGNSGGPLVNLHCEVVGINTAIASRTGGYQGVGFAVPIGLARSVMQSILDEGHVVRGWLGIYIGDLTDALRAAFDTNIRYGALVQQVVEDGPADKAGIKDGDIIVAIDSKRVEDVDDLRMRVAQTRPGTKISVSVLRDGKARSLEVVLEELESDEAPLAGAIDDVFEDLGFDVAFLNDEWRDRLELDPGLEGVVVTDVRNGSVAAQEGLRLGDVIVEAGRKPVMSVADVREQTARLEKGDVLLLTVITRDARRFVALRIPE